MRICLKHVSRYRRFQKTPDCGMYGAIVQSSTSNHGLVNITFIPAEKKVSRMGVSAAHYAIGFAPQRLFDILESNFNKFPEKLQKIGKISVASGPPKCIIHPIIRDLCEDYDASSDIGSIAIFKNRPPRNRNGPTQTSYER